MYSFVPSDDLYLLAVLNQGLYDLRQRGWETIVQDQSSRVVWGMPETAVRMGAACQILPAETIGPAIERAMRQRAAGKAARPNGLVQPARFVGKLLAGRANTVY